MTDLRTFGLPESVDGTDADVALAGKMVDAWRSDGLFQISCDRWQVRKVEDAFEASRRFFALPVDLKARCVSDLTYAGYTAASEIDDAETFTICPDVSLDDIRVSAQWPCHGPVPWPSVEYRRAMRTYFDELGRIGEKLAHLIAIGLDLPDFEALAALTEDGWHHLVVQRFPAAAEQRHPADTPDYGLLVITAQDGVLTVSPGEILRFVTNGLLSAVPSQVRLGEQKQQVMTYFHEPSFDAGIRPMLGPDHGYLHYGTHFTDLYLRRYPDRCTSQRIIAEDRLAVLADLSRRASVGA
jgi:isopenicillin N synthase-like dioxygenase